MSHKSTGHRGKSQGAIHGGGGHSSSHLSPGRSGTSRHHHSPSSHHTSHTSHNVSLHRAPSSVRPGIALNRSTAMPFARRKRSEKYGVVIAGIIGLIILGGIIATIVIVAIAPPESPHGFTAPPTCPGLQVPINHKDTSVFGAFCSDCYQHQVQNQNPTIPIPIKEDWCEICCSYYYNSTVSFDRYDCKDSCKV